MKPNDKSAVEKNYNPTHIGLPELENKKLYKESRYATLYNL